MTKTTRKLIALLSSIVMIITFSFIGVIPAVSVDATNAAELAAQIDALDGLTATVALDGVTVNVSGTRNNATATLNLNIPTVVTLNWGAELSGSIRGAYVLVLTGGGVFNLTSAGKIDNRGTGGALDAQGMGMKINIRGELNVTGSNGLTLNVGADNIDIDISDTGFVNNNGSNSAINITNNITGTKINVGTGGRVSSIPNSYAINDGSGQSGVVFDNDTEIRVSGGLVEAQSACAIRSSGSGSIVTVAGGIVRNAAASNPNSTIYMNGGTGENIIIDGGEVYTTNTGTTSYVLQTTGDVTVKAGTVTSLAGRAINLVGLNSTATVTGGRVRTETGTAISTATTTLDEVANAKVIVHGGIVEATGRGTDYSGTAIRITGANSTVEISGGTATLNDHPIVTAKNGFAIDASGRPGGSDLTPINVSGGLVFAWGNALNKVVSPSAKLERTDLGFIVAWNTTNGTGGPYRSGSTDDLIWQIPDVTAPEYSGLAWDDEDPFHPVSNDGGIRYGDFTIEPPVFREHGFLHLGVKIERALFILRIINGTGDPMRFLREDNVTSISARLDNQPVQIPSGSVITDYPVSGDKFSGWTSAPTSVGTGGTIDDPMERNTTFTMPDNDVTLTANFNPRYLLHIVNGKITGTTTFPGIDSYGYYAPGETVNIARDAGFLGWERSDGDSIGASDTITITMPDNPLVIWATPAEAPETPEKFKTTIDGGRITSTNSGEVPLSSTEHEDFAGTILNITANAPEPGKVFSHWTLSPPDIGGVPITGGASFNSQSAVTSFIMPNDNVTITAVYNDDLYNLTVNGGTGSGIYIFEQIVTIRANNPPRGMIFSGWTSSNGGEFADSTATVTSFKMPDNNVTVSPHYENDPDYEPGNVGPGPGVLPLPPLPEPEQKNIPDPNTEQGDETETDTVTAATLPGDVTHMLITGRHIAFVQGIGDSLFAPNRDMSRADTAQMFFNLLIDKNVEITKTFPDAAEGAWYKDAVEALASLGILTGYDGLYHPDDPITRAEFVTVAVRFTNEIMGEYEISEFSDVSQAHWAHDYIVTAASYGWIHGSGNGRFEPDRHITRAEVVALTNRLLGRIPDESYITGHPDLVFYEDVPETHWAYYYIAEASNAHSEYYDDPHEHEYWIES